MPVQQDAKKKTTPNLMRNLHLGGKKAHRNYFKGDARYKTVAVMGETSVGGQGAIVQREGRKFETRLVDFIHGQIKEETTLMGYSNDPVGTCQVQPGEDKMQKLEKAQRTYLKLEKKLGDEMILALSRAQTWDDKKVCLELCPGQPEKPRYDDSRYEARWW